MKKGKTLREFVASPDAKRHQTRAEREAKRHNHHDRIRKALLNGGLTEQEIVNRHALTSGEVRALIADYRRSGANIVRRGDVWSIDRHMAPDSESAWKIRGKPGKPYRFGLIADTHLGSKHCRLDVCEDLYDWFSRQGISIVFHCGNWIEGEARFNKHELVPEAHGMQQQLDYFVEHYPQRDGIETRYVTGDDHEGWYCFEPGVEILTRDRGWVAFPDLIPGEMVAGQDDGRFAWQPVERVVIKHHKGKMVRISDRSFEVAVTPDHRFEVWQRSSMHGAPKQRVMTAHQIADDYKSRCIGIPRAVGGWEGASRRLPTTTEGLSTGDLAELCAWYATEGYTHKNIVGIAQSQTANPHNCDRIASLLAKTGRHVGRNKHQLRITHPALADLLRAHCGSGSENKHLPTWITDAQPEILERVLDTLIEGDGSFRPRGWRFYSKSKRLIEQATEIAQKLGFATTERKDAVVTCLTISAERQIAYLFREPVLFDYDGPVHCASVKNQRILVRKDGKAFWSMNCQREGVDIGKMLADTARRAGRNDLVNLGYKEAFVTLEHPKSRKHARMLIDHPGGGSSYAVSYAPQKRVEAAQGGEKPAIWCFGHWHKAGYFVARGVHCVLVPCTKDLDTFGRKKGLEYVVGGQIIEASQDEGGAITGFNFQQKLFFDRGYHNQQFSLSGPSERRVTR